MTEHMIEALCWRSVEISREKGWMDEKDRRPFYTTIVLMHSELSEAVEDYRNHKKLDEVYYQLKGVDVSKEERARSVEPAASDIAAWKPCGIPIELADFVIRVCQRVGAEGHGALLQQLFLHSYTCRQFDDFEELLVELHNSLSRAYSASKVDRSNGGLLHAGHVEALAVALKQVFEFCQEHDVDLWSAINEKEAYNRTRPARHGGKKI